MASAIIILAFIGLFVGTLTLIQFPAIAADILTVFEKLMYYFGQGTSILWFFVPKSITLTVIGLVISIEVIIRGFKIFLFVYDKLKNG